MLLLHSLVLAFGVKVYHISLAKISPLLLGHYYDDPDYSYIDYWENRQYEHLAEIAALKYLLKNKHYRHAADIGGGFGRLSGFLKKYAEKVTMVEPSKQLREQAAQKLQGKGIEILEGVADALPLKENSLDLAILIRVSHHLPNLKEAIQELARVLENEGTLIIEIANSTHFKERVRSWMVGKPITLEPKVLHSSPSPEDETVPFINHHPRQVEQFLKEYGFKIEKKLSVSNFRSPLLKKLLPRPILMAMELPLQKALARTNFGPSIFYRVRKVTNG